MGADRPPNRLRDAINAYLAAHPDVRGLSDEEKRRILFNLVTGSEVALWATWDPPLQVGDRITCGAPSVNAVDAAWDRLTARHPFLTIDDRALPSRPPPPEETLGYFRGIRVWAKRADPAYDHAFCAALGIRWD